MGILCKIFGHKYTAYNSPFTRYARCFICGAGISAEEASKKKIKIRWHERWSSE